VLQQLFALHQGSAIKRLGLAVIGHVDMQPINPKSDSHLCTELHQAFAFKPSPPWETVPAEADEAERQKANNQLAWCRAASVMDKIRAGMERAGGKQKRPDVEIAVLGMGTSWLRAQAEGRCPSHGKAWSERKDCSDARRVDLLIRFEPRATVAQSVCDTQGDDPATALYCLQHCAEQAAVGSRTGSGVRTATAPLFRDGPSRDRAIPAGWYLKRLPKKANRYLDMKRIRETLEVK
jgi:hypothetical protein